MQRGLPGPGCHRRKGLSSFAIESGTDPQPNINRNAQLSSADQAASASFRQPLSEEVIQVRNAEDLLSRLFEIVIDAFEINHISVDDDIR